MEDLVKKIIRFRDERNWQQFHNPKDLAISLNLEASELLEIFQWLTSEEAVDKKLNNNMDLHSLFSIKNRRIYNAPILI